jgi:hypothetical protein
MRVCDAKRFRNHSTADLLRVFCVRKSSDISKKTNPEKTSITSNRLKVTIAREFSQSNCGFPMASNLKQNRRISS